MKDLIYDHAKSKRMIIPSMKILKENLDPWLTHELQSVKMERIYFDSEQNWLDLGGHLRAMRSIDEGASTDFVLSYRSQEGALPQKVSYPVSKDALVTTAEEWFGIHEIQPRFRVTYTFKRYQIHPQISMSILHDLHYFALIGKQEIPMGSEQSIRVELTYSESETPLSQKLIQALYVLPTLPQNNIRLMGFCMLQKLLEAPVYNELMGFEYDMKFKVSHPSLNLDQLPFPFLDMRISGSLRRYYDGFRAGLRDGTAILVRKGEKENIRGVIKRTEEKERGVEAWELEQTDLEMRRYKREVRVYNPSNLRIYTISLHQCIAGEEMYQLEVGYDGTLVDSTLPLIQKFWKNGQIKNLVKLSELLEKKKYPILASDLKKRASELSNHHDSQGQRERLDRKKEEGTWTQEAEDEIIDDLLVIRNILLEDSDISPTKKTKRKWLRQVHARSS